MIFLILLLGFLLRLINLNQSFWLDEAIQVLAVKNNSYQSLLSEYVRGDFHPPLYHFILKFWTGIFGYSEIAARVPSIIFGVVTILFVYLIGKKLFNQKVGIIAALFLTVNPLAIYYSQEARMYSLAAMLVTATIWFLLKKNWLWFLLFLTASLYTDYLVYLMLPVYFFISTDKKKFCLFSFIAFILLVPWLPYFWQQLSVGLSVAAANPGWGQVVGGFELKAIPLTVVKFIIGRITLDNKFLYASIVGPLSALYLFLALRAKNKFLWLWFLLPLVLGALISLKVSVFSYFRFLFVLPAFILMLAHGARNRGAAVIIISVSLVSLAIFNLYPKFQRENWREVARYINIDPGVVYFPSLAQSAPLTYYGPNLVMMDKRDFLITGNTPIYLARYVQEIFDPKDSEKVAIEANGYRRVEERSFNGVVIWKYSL